MEEINFSPTAPANSSWDSDSDSDSDSSNLSSSAYDSHDDDDMVDNSDSDDNMNENEDDIQYFDVEAQLCSSDRDYLVRSNNGDKVMVKTLNGKTILLLKLGFPLKPVGDDTDLALELLEAYHKLYLRGDFEVVMVAWMRAGKRENNQASFDHYLRDFPWLTIPFHDSKSRMNICHYLVDFFEIVDGNGRITDVCTEDLLVYGPQFCYPFTTERMNEIRNEVDRILENDMSLETLLTSPTRDYVVSIHHDDDDDVSHRVLISDLKNKLVGIYLCEDMAGLNKFKKVYNRCIAKGLEIEVVLVYVEFQDTLEDYEKGVRDVLRGMPWLALPFSDKRSRRRICSILDLTIEDMFVIVGPDGSFVDQYAGDVISKYGINAYPFTRDKVFRNEMARLKALNLESLLCCRGRDYLIHKDGSRFPVSGLKGRNILLYFDERPGRSKIFRRLIKWYRELKVEDDAFEVIYVSDAVRESWSFNTCYLSLMPWLAIPYDSDHSSFLAKTIMNGLYGSHQLVAFGADGKFLTMDAEYYLREYGLEAYPFSDSNLFEEIESRFSEKHNWI